MAGSSDKPLVFTTSPYSSYLYLKEEACLLQTLQGRHGATFNLRVGLENGLFCSSLSGDLIQDPHSFTIFYNVGNYATYIIYLCTCWVCCLPPYETDYQEDGVRSVSFTPVSPVPRTVPGTNRCSISIS